MNYSNEEQLVAEKGFLDVEVQPGIDYKAEIDKLRKEKNAVILAHYYQVPEIQEIADFVGDSLDLSQKAARTNADIIVFAGVKFMGETAKILSPTKKVLLPDMNAGCSLADSCPPDQFRKFLDQHPGHTVVTYINCTAEIKAMSDVIVTSSNALKIINTIPKDQPIICAPDINLGRYLVHETGRDMVLWNGACEVHIDFSMDKINFLKKKNPAAKLIAHPECPSAILEAADFVGSTSKLLSYTKENPAQEFIVVTEEGILHQMRKSSPEKKFIPAPVNRYTQCACGECPYMKLNSLKKIYLCLKYEKPEIFVNEQIREKAYLPIKKMLDLSAVL